MIATSLIKNSVSFLWILAALFISSPTEAANITSIRQIADLNPGSAASSPSNWTVLGEALYFSAYTSEMGRELWKYDGTNITLAANINDTVTDIGGGLFIGNSSTPGSFTAYRNKLYFSAFNPRRGGELWSFDGTNALRVSDINPDANDNIKTNPNNSWPSELTVFNDVLYFSAANGNNESNYELWKYNGTNVTMVTNINPGNNASSFPRGFTVFKNALYFMANNGNHGFELWKHTGTQTVQFDLNPGGSSSSSFPNNFIEFNGVLYFQAFHSGSGFELWKTDGVSVSIAADINPGVSDSNPEFLMIYKGSLYFRASDGIHGSELWKTDGTNFTMVADINPVGDSFPKNLNVFNDKLYLSANDGANGWELWNFDGLSANLVTNLNPSGDSFPEWLVPFNDSLYFVATTQETGYELWRYDGVVVNLAANINPDANSSFPNNFQTFNNQLVFDANSAGSFDLEPWTLIAAPFSIKSIQPAGNQMQIIWNTLGGTTNILQASGDVAGPYTNLSAPIRIEGITGATTNFTDPEAANTAARFYRIVQP